MKAAIATLYEPTDVHEAFREWGAACGPSALAAAFGCNVADVRHLFPFHRGWVNPSHMIAALDLAGVHHREPRPGETHPCRGLLFIQFLGPWMKPGVPIAARYKHTHWIAVVRNHEAERLVWDCNSETGWMLFEQWRAVLAPELIAHNRGSDGWRVARAIELVPRATKGTP
jgi:hypothetical protein